MIRTMLTGMVNDPPRIMRKLRIGDNKAIEKAISILGKAVNGWSVGKVAKILHIKVDDSIKDMPFTELAIELVRSVLKAISPLLKAPQRRRDCRIVQQAASDS